MKRRAKAVSEALVGVVPLPSAVDKDAPLDIVSSYTGFTIDLDADAGNEEAS